MVANIPMVFVCSSIGPFLDTQKSDSQRCLFGVFRVNQLIHKSKFSKRLGL